MTSPFASRAFRCLFLAQVLSLLGSGLTTVALGLLAFSLAGDGAGAVLGTALFLKMVAYVGLSPLANAVVERLPRRAVLVALDLVRASIALSLPFVDQIWQIYLLIFLLQAASAAFTPAFQATIPDILPDEAVYTRALSFSRLAYDLESLVSPMLAAALLLVVPFSALFAGNALGFLLSAILVLASRLPERARPEVARPFRERVTRGLRLYFAAPPLRGLLALNGAVSAAGAMVIVNSVVLVRGELGLGDGDLALVLGVFGLGSMLVALLLPRWLDTRPDRPVMLAGALVLALGSLALAAVLWTGVLSWGLLAVIWLVIGMGESAILTPSARLLRRAVAPEDRPAIFTAQFALSHACWLVAYPFAGYAGKGLGLAPTACLLGLVALGSAWLAARAWPASAAEA